ncbi:leucyl aminopeptidase [Candidatus Uhrbacteria bacterium CG10_big_fil_rev_8_21_14_0_10_48_11]|uniref:Probable cytosol aminopeptidase n=1 Tax=Candidatus Uhrbacteria bacterium CG10_big_fil_rev_8_21_14_0_10_48_11 TaxID=1975037 RepID=A0A2M8LFL2_9BACT|nr:MAG: leucyl aminopeptidase [Candidatus Uhrbacteria bacterium CG10_big_fil_rev_8_21_14_0_10_48_11]
MKLTAQKADALSFATDVLIVGAFFQDKKLSPTAQAIDRAFDGQLSGYLGEQGFEGKKHEVVLLPTYGKIGARRILVVGLGKAKQSTSASVREAAAFAIKRAGVDRAKKIAVVFSTAPRRSAAAVRTEAAAFAEGALLGAYVFNRYHGKDIKDEQAKISVAEVTVLCSNASEVSRVKQGLEEGTALAEMTMMTRDLVNTPAADMTPKHMVDVAKQIAKDNTKVKLEIFDKKIAEKMGMGAFLGVAKGSDEPPYFIHLSFKPRGAKKVKKLFLAGKGITFDTGGISLKPAAALEQWTMKMDMAGGATILGLFSKISALGLKKVEVHGLIPCTENMPSGKAMKPHDIVRALNGKTIEVVNTDAEGRLVLADALSFAVEQKADAIVDLATLTGACMVALGDEIAGSFGNDKPLLAKIKRASDAADESVWELPMPESYRPLLKSRIADLRNIGTSRYGDSIVAGLFLKEFVNGTPWVHLDIAGPAWAEREMKPSMPAGATGFGVRLLVELIRQFA